MEEFKTLISKDSKGKVRVAEVSYEWNDDLHGYVIHRTTYQFGGKKTEQPDKVITCGKVKRTVTEQCQLEFNHLVKEYSDKGYKLLDDNIENYSEQQLIDILPSCTTNPDNIPKPMLAKQADKVTNPKTWDKVYYASRKIDGLRCLIYMGSDGELHTSSRGAMNYDAAMIEILSHPLLIKLFDANPSLILDGEVFRYGMNLQTINSYARTQKTVKDYSVLQFYLYDIVDLNKTVEERITTIAKIKKLLNLGWNPEKEFKDGELRIQVVPHVKVSGWNNILALHNNYVEEGWEGVVCRLSKSIYGPNKRTNDMLKVKMYRDSEFLVVGYELGLRGAEDMVFVCETPNGKEFKAKPYGDKVQKEYYVEHFDEEFKDRYAVIKFFYYSNGNDEENGVPLQPNLISFRIPEDLPFKD